MNFIIFRNDRIGDFLVSSLLINDFKKKNKNFHFTVVCSKKNYYYVKNSKLVDNVLLIPSNFFERIFFYLKLLRKKYDISIVLDGKKKSILSSIILRSPKKILITNKASYKFLFHFLFSKIIHILPNETRIGELKKVSKYLNFNFDDQSTKYFNNHNLVTDKIKTFINNINDYNIFHFDEKWIFDKYIKTYQNIEPSRDDLFNFIKDILIESKNDLLITTGKHQNSLINFLKLQFSRFDENIYTYKFNNQNVYIVDNIDIFNLEYIISKSSIVITCEGTPSHLANMYNKKIIAIIDKSEARIFFNWTAHFTKISLLPRSNFKDISSQIIKNL